MTPKRAGVRLRDWLESERRSQGWIAEQIDTHQTNVSAWIRGRPIPLEAAIKIRGLTGIEVEEWVVEADETGPRLPATGTD
jgi:hypothetical protein